MELQQIFKNQKNLRIKKKARPVQEPEKLLHISEVKQLSPSKVSTISSEIAEIPYTLGKSEKFENKPQIISAFTELGFIHEKSREVGVKVKTESKEHSQHSTSPMSVEHMFYKKIITPFTPGVVRIRPKENREGSEVAFQSSARKETAFLATQRQLSTPQPSISTKNNFSRFAESPGKSRFPVCVRTITSFQRSSFFESPDKKRFSNRVVTSKNIKINEKEEEEVKGYLKSPDILEYVGGFLQGQREGFAEIIYKNGDKFKGFLKKNLKEGTGKFFYKKFGLKSCCYSV
jgi:hypothetical protein